MQEKDKPVHEGSKARKMKRTLDANLHVFTPKQKKSVQSLISELPGGDVMQEKDKPVKSKEPKGDSLGAQQKSDSKSSSSDMVPPPGSSKWKPMLEGMYAKYAPHQVPRLDEIMKKYEGR